ncbi:MAG: hypothetical protein VX225_07170 [Pseudomonadota bacterium]|nr:hypothetical protein [Pseudomonadota bacterium]
MREPSTRTKNKIVRHEWNADEQKLKDSNFDLGIKWDNPFDGVTHELSVPVPGIDPIPATLLEERLKKIREQQS